MIAQLHQPASLPPAARGQTLALRVKQQVAHRTQPGVLVRASASDSEAPQSSSQPRAPREVVPTPEAVPVEHSSTYLLRSRRQFNEEQLPSTSERPEPFTGNAVQWYLKRLDKNMAEDEKLKPAAMMYYKASQTPAGSSAVKNMGSVVEAAAKLGGKAVQAAVPVGKWALLQGLGAAGKLISSDRKDSKRGDDSR